MSEELDPNDQLRVVFEITDSMYSYLADKIDKGDVTIFEVFGALRIVESALLDSITTVSEEYDLTKPGEQ